MTTAQDMIQDALEMLGVYAPGETMTSADASRGLVRLNNMLDMWSNEALFCFAITEQSALLQVGVSLYTIGTGGTFNMTRPLRLIEGAGAAYAQDSTGNNYLIAVVPRDQWNLIGNRSSSQTSNFPNTLFYDPQFPLGQINVYPTPNAAYTMFWDSYLQLSTFTALTTTVSLPPGYELAIKTNLAVQIKPYWSAAQLDPDVRLQASESKAAIKRTNMRSMVSRYDDEIVARGRSSYNPYTDNYGSRG